MRITNCFVQGRNQDQSLCEDGVYVSDHFIAVVDGATAKSKVQYEGKSSGRIAMEKVIEAIATIPADSDAYQAVRIITDYIADWYRSLGKYEYLKDNSIDRPTAAAMIYSCRRKELWCVGDCQALVDDEYINNDKLIDSVMMNARALWLQMEILNGKTIEELCEKDTGWDFIFPLLERQGQFQNRKEYTEFNYAMYDGFEIPENLIRVVDVAKAKNIVMSSDGYPALFKTFEESEAHLAKVLKEDPLCFTSNKSFKTLSKMSNSFDDRCFIRMEL